MPIEPILSVQCDEPNNSVVRHIYPLALSLENIERMWMKTKEFRTLFSDEINGDFKKFCEVILSADDCGKNVYANGLFWVIDDFVGIYYMSHIVPSIEARVHYTFFDRRHTGRENLTKAILKYVIHRYKFRRLSVEVPTYASKHTFAFVEQLGFQREGRKRRCIFYKEEWRDVILYGILAEEIENGVQ